MEINREIDSGWLEEKVLLCKLSDEDCNLLDSLFEVVRFAAGDIMLAQGDAGGFLNLLRSGEAEVAYESDGHQVRVALLDEAALFGEMSFLTGEPAGATVTASQACEVYRLSRGAYSQLMIENQDMVYSLMAHMLVNAGSVIRRMNDEQVVLKNLVYPQT